MRTTSNFPVRLRNRAKKAGLNISAVSRIALEEYVKLIENEAGDNPTKSAAGANSVNGEHI